MKSLKGLPVNDVHGNPVGHIVEATRDGQGNVTARLSIHSDFARKHLASQPVSMSCRVKTSVINQSPGEKKTDT